MSYILCLSLSEYLLTKMSVPLPIGAQTWEHCETTWLSGKNCFVFPHSFLSHTFTFHLPAVLQTLLPRWTSFVGRCHFCGAAALSRSHIAQIINHLLWWEFASVFVLSSSRLADTCQTGVSWSLTIQVRDRWPLKQWLIKHRRDSTSRQTHQPANDFSSGCRRLL